MNQTAELPRRPGAVGPTSVTAFLPWRYPYQVEGVVSAYKDNYGNWRFHFDGSLVADRDLENLSISKEEALRASAHDPRFVK